MKTNCPVLVNGEWLVPDEAPSAPVFNPSHGSVIAQVPMLGASMVDQAAEAAAAAFPGWSEVSPVERARIFFRYKMRLEDEFERLAMTITREHGKTLGEARGDIRRGIECVEFACGIPSLLMGESLGNIAKGIDCDSIRQPIGVCAGITPFNFPAMVPLWMFPIAIACGNTFILKPSEKVPLTAIRLAELLIESGLPDGVLNLVHGGRECVDAILTHPKIQAISFVGSTPVAKYISETGTRHGKRVQAAGGAKNFILVMPDADIDFSSTAIIEGAFGCAGERCMAGSTMLAIGESAKTVLPSVVEKAMALRLGPTDIDPDAKMGPVISKEHADRVCDLVSASAGEGAKILNDGRDAKVPAAPGGFYVGATILDEVQDGMATTKHEVFGPVLNVMRSANLDEAIALANQSNYGNGAAIFTRSGKAMREFKHRINAGMVGINIGVPAPMSFFPFSGWNDSFFGDLHLQGKEGVQFFTRQKVTTSRWFGNFDSDVWQR